MGKKNVHILLDGPLADAIERYARGHGITFTAALSLLAARGLRDEGLFISEGDGSDEHRPAATGR